MIRWSDECKLVKCKINTPIPCNGMLCTITVMLSFLFKQLLVRSYLLFQGGITSIEYVDVGVFGWSI